MMDAQGFPSARQPRRAPASIADISPPLPAIVHGKEPVHTRPSLARETDTREPNSRRVSSPSRPSPARPERPNAQSVPP